MSTSDTHYDRNCRRCTLNCCECPWERKMMMITRVSGTCVINDDSDGADRAGDIDGDVGEVEDIDKTILTTTASDIQSWSAARRPLFLNITLSQFADGGELSHHLCVCISKYQSDTWPGDFFAAEEAPFRKHELFQMNESSPLSLLFIPPRCRGRRRATANGLSDERDKWQRCFGSGDSALEQRCVFVRECARACVLGRQKGRKRRESEGDRRQ